MWSAVEIPKKYLDMRKAYLYFLEAFMKAKKILIPIVAIVAILAVLVAAYFTIGEEGAYGTAWSLVAPVIAIALALITKEVYSSLFIGITIGAIIKANFNFSGIIDTITKGFVSEKLTNADGDVVEVFSGGLIPALSASAGIFVFLVLLGIMVALINKSGGSQAFGRWATKNIKTKVGAAIATFVLGVLIFIDDYFNCLTVGSVMSPVTDSHKISRAKLAFLIDATAAPVCMIAPVSSWAAAVSSCVDSETLSGIELFVRAIPFNFYSLLMLGFIIMISVIGFDYGKMSEFEIKAQNGDLGILNSTKEESNANPKGKVIDLILPIIILVVSSILGLLYVGGFFSGADFVTAFGDTDATVGLPWGALIALAVIIVYLIVRRLITFKEAMECIPKGFIAMVPAILILTLATTLKDITGGLGSDVFVENIMSGVGDKLAAFLPAIIFIIACFLAFSTGTSWGTFGILIPIVTSVFPESHELFFVGISACLAGAVCGDHCSPISDTTIMASAGAQCNHIDHVQTQLPYAITVAAVSFVSFVFAGFVPKAYIALPFAFVLMFLTVMGIKIFTQKKAKGNN